jgi:hypothetical protein
VVAVTDEIILFAPHDDGVTSVGLRWQTPRYKNDFAKSGTRAGAPRTCNLLERSFATNCRFIASQIKKGKWKEHIRATQKPLGVRKIAVGQHLNVVKEVRKWRKTRTNETGPVKNKKWCAPFQKTKESYMAAAKESNERSLRTRGCQATPDEI